MCTTFTQAECVYERNCSFLVFFLFHFQLVSVAKTKTKKNEKFRDMHTHTLHRAECFSHSNKQQWLLLAYLSYFLLLSLRLLYLEARSFLLYPKLCSSFSIRWWCAPESGCYTYIALRIDVIFTSCYKWSSHSLVHNGPAQTTGTAWGIYGQAIFVLFAVWVASLIFSYFKVTTTRKWRKVVSRGCAFSSFLFTFLFCCCYCCYCCCWCCSVFVVAVDTICSCCKKHSAFYFLHTFSVQLFKDLYKSISWKRATLKFFCLFLWIWWGCNVCVFVEELNPCLAMPCLFWFFFFVLFVYFRWFRNGYRVSTYLLLGLIYCTYWASRCVCIRLHDFKPWVQRIISLGKKVI